MGTIASLVKKGRMTMSKKKIVLTAIFVACGIVAMGGVLIARPAGADVKVSMERNSGEVASRSFRFADVPSPIKDNAAAKASLMIVDGEIDGNSAALSAIKDIPKIWVGQHPLRGMRDWFTSAVRMTFSRPMPVQVGGDAVGERLSIEYRVAKRQVDVIDFRALSASTVA